MDAGVLKDIPAKSTLSINGVVMTGAQIDAKLKGYIATIQAADAAKQQAKAAVTARVNMTVEGRDFYQQLKKAVIASFGAQSPQLDDFGLAPAKPKAAKTTAQKAITAAKAQLTVCQKHDHQRLSCPAAARRSQGPGPPGRQCARRRGR
jgi:hypothetical protein